MRVSIYDVTFRGEVEIDECFPDDPESVAAAIQEIKEYGESWQGGGAAPMSVLYEVKA